MITRGILQLATNNSGPAFQQSDWEVSRCLDTDSIFTTRGYDITANLQLSSTVHSFTLL